MPLFNSVVKIPLTSMRTQVGRKETSRIKYFPDNFNTPLSFLNSDNLFPFLLLLLQLLQFLYFNRDMISSAAPKSLDSVQSMGIKALHMWKTTEIQAKSV